MQLTKYSHSCVRLDDGDRTLVIDPGVFSEVETALEGSSAVLITHEHADHIDIDRVRSVAQRDPRLRIWAPEPLATTLGELGEQVVVTAPEQAFEAGGFAIRTFGGQHALIHSTIPIVPNVGYLIDDTVYHPGDSLIVPTAPIGLLLAPIHAPWSKTAEVIDYVVAVRAARAVGIHDSLLTEPGRNLVESHIGRIGGEHGCEYLRLAPAETLDV